MRPECSQVVQTTSVRLEVVQEDKNTFVESEFVNNYTASLWVAQEPAPAYRVDPQNGAVLVSYGYFDDVYGPYRGRYILPRMKEVAPGARLRWRIEDPALLEKLLLPGAVTRLRVRVALQEFPESNIRGSQPVDAYVEASCLVQSKATVLRK